MKLASDRVERAIHRRQQRHQHKESFHHHRANNHRALLARNFFSNLEPYSARQRRRSGICVVSSAMVNLAFSLIRTA